MFREFDITIIFAKFQLMIEKLLSCFIQIIHLDGDGEFDNKLFCFFLDSYGITYQPSCPYTLAQNCVVERKHHDIIEKRLLHIN